MLDFLRITGLFVVTAVAEIVGCYLPWLVVTQGRTGWLLLPAAASLAAFAWLLNLHPSAAALATPPPSGLRLTWFGHSAVLIEIDGVRLLTDPMWGPRAAPSTVLGPARFHEPPTALEALGDLDAVIISHDHYDHLDMLTIRAERRRDHLRAAFQHLPYGAGVLGRHGLGEEHRVEAVDGLVERDRERHRVRLRDGRDGRGDGRVRRGEVVGGGEGFQKRIQVVGRAPTHPPCIGFWSSGWK